jgi:hypothetical protein
MKDETALPGRSATSYRNSEGTVARAAAREPRPPMLLIQVPLDSRVRASLNYDCEADRKQLVAWLATQPRVKKALRVLQLEGPA